MCYTVRYMMKHGDYNVNPLSYVRYSGMATIEYLEGAEKGTQKVVPISELSDSGGELALVKVLRNVRIEA